MRVVEDPQRPQQRDRSQQRRAEPEAPLASLRQPEVAPVLEGPSADDPRSS
jgi:hypothetical protein